MVDLIFFESIVRAFITIFAIMDPFISVPIFLSLTRKDSATKKRLIAMEAVGIAGGLLFLFLLFGQGLLTVLGISLDSMQIAGGIILTIMGIELVLNVSFPKEKGKSKKVSPAAVVLGTPLLTGPGVITTAIILSGQYGILVTAIAAILALAFTWFILRHSDSVTKLIGETGTELLSRIMGLLLVAIAVQFILSGIKGVF